MPERSYIYYDFTISICPVCLKRIDAKIIIEDGKVFMLKKCSEHGAFKVMVASDADYYKKCRHYLKPGEMPHAFNSETLFGCPYDCGLCPDHEQHSCLTIIEITDRCNLACPTCYSESSPMHGRHRTVEEVKDMLNLIVKNEGQPDVVQISGGEPTVHPDFFSILDFAKTLPIRHLMVNTNGIRIAKDEEFVKRLAGYAPDFEIYLQFDSLKPSVLKMLRGEDLSDVRKRALDHLNKYNLSTTLVAVLEKNLNTNEIGDIISFALKQPCVRGVTFQPTSASGRLENFNYDDGRITLSEVRSEILKQSDLFNENDIIPVPCNPDALAMAYALKLDGNVFPLTRFINPDDLIHSGRNTIVYEQDEKLKSHFLKIFSTGSSTDKASTELNKLFCCLPEINAPTLKYENLFRIIIMQFMDAWNFDVRAVKKSCVHIVSKEGKIIPFETMNIFYRDEKIKRLQQLQQTVNA